MQALEERRAGLLAGDFACRLLPAPSSASPIDCFFFAPLPLSFLPLGGRSARRLAGGDRLDAALEALDKATGDRPLARRTKPTFLSATATAARSRGCGLVLRRLRTRRRTRTMCGILSGLARLFRWSGVKTIENQTGLDLTNQRTVNAKKLARCRPMRGCESVLC